MTPFERLVRQRPEPDALWRYRRTLDRPIAIEFEAERDNGEVAWGLGADHGIEGTDGVTWTLGPELSRRGSLVKYVATYHSPHEGSYSVVLHVREGELEPLDDPEATCELGAILSSMEWYEFGTDLETLRDSGFRLSWPAAQWLYEAARDELVDFHHDAGKAHGALEPRHIRFALFETPYSQHSHPLLPRHLDGEIPPPVLYLYSSRSSASDAERAGELSMLAYAIAQLTTHPDPEIDRLLRDTSKGSHEVLRDLLLERGRPVELLLIDRSSTPSLQRLPLAGADDEDIDDEFEALWHRVLELDPMIDTSKPEIFDLAGPVFA